MDAGVLYDYGSPVFDEFYEPIGGHENMVVEVKAAAISNFDIIWASGAHYLKPRSFPCVAGREGVGKLKDGRRVYFDDPLPPFGSMAQRTLIAEQSAIWLPDDVDDAVASVLGNSGLAAWLPLEWRAQLSPGETVLILGAGGIVGRLAVQSAKLLGAGRVVAADRNVTSLQNARSLGADALVTLVQSEDNWVSQYREAAQGEVDVIIDYLWGRPAELALETAAIGARLIQIGTMAGETLRLAASVVRKQSLAILGYTNYHVPKPVRLSTYRHMAKLARNHELKVDVQEIPLLEIETAWELQKSVKCKRVVVIP